MKLADPISVFGDQTEVYRPASVPEDGFQDTGSIPVRGEMTERRANWRWGSRCKSGRKERLTTTFTASRARAPARGHVKRR